MPGRERRGAKLGSNISSMGATNRDHSAEAMESNGGGGGSSGAQSGAVLIEAQQRGAEGTSKERPGALGSNRKQSGSVGMNGGRV